MYLVRTKRYIPALGALFAAAIAVRAVMTGSWTAACLAGGIACLAWVATGRRGRVVAFNAGVLLILASAGLAYLEERAPERIQTFSDAPNVFILDPVLGHRPAANLHTRATMHVGADLIYDVTYDTNEDALRVGPPETGESPRDCVFFFGCSYTFGEGVENDETLPYRVGVKAAGRYSARNFAYSGYGPHQMLAAIESGLVDRTARCDPKVAIYQSHPHHVARAAGKWWWDRHGPAYAIREDGRVERVGSFADRAAESTWSTELLRNSPMAQQLFDRSPVDIDDIRLFQGIVQRSRDLLAERYPGIEFHILHWDIEAPPVYRDGWTGDGISIHLLSAVLPFDRSGWEHELLLPHDVHPTARTHALIADYVVESVLHLDPAGSAATRAE